MVASLKFQNFRVTITPYTGTFTCSSPPSVSNNGCVWKYCNPTTLRNSVRVGGKLQYRSNPVRFQRVVASAGPMVQIYGRKTYDSPPNCYLAMSGLSDLYFPSKIPSWDTSSEVSACGVKLRSKISGVRVNLLDLYRTRVESANMVVDTIHRLANGYSAIRRKNFKQASQYLGFTIKPPKDPRKTSPDRLWLEYSYGWAPLIGDVHTMLNKTFGVPNTVVRASFRSQTSVSTSGPDNLTKFNDVELRRTDVSARVRVTANAPELQALAQYGINNPALLAWEMIPYSFVVDWFLPVGNYLEDLLSCSGLSFSDETTSIKRQNSSTRIYYADAKNTASWRYTVSIAQQKCTWTGVDFERRLGSPRTPELNFKSPLSLGHFANAMALLSTAFSSKSWSHNKLF